MKRYDWGKLRLEYDPEQVDLETLIASGAIRRYRKPPPGRARDNNRIDRVAPDTIITREAAIALGFTVYRTGRPCRHGHAGWRWVAGGTCLTCRGGT